MELLMQTHGASSNTGIKCIVAIVVYASLHLIKGISEPWLGTYDAGDGALYSAIAHNYLHYGIWKLRFGQAVNLAHVADLVELKFYQHHPPLFPLSVAASFALFGECEASARLVSILFSLAGIFLLYFLSRKIYGNCLAVIMTLIFATLPTVLYFGRKVGYESQTLFLILLGVLLYLRFLETPNGWRLGALFLAVGAGLTADWPAYFLVPCLSFHYWRTRRSDEPFKKVLLLGLPGFAVLIFLFISIQSYLVDPASVRSMIGQGLVYAGLMPKDSAWAAQYSEAKVSFTAIEYATRLGGRMDLLFGYPVILLALCGIFPVLGTDGPKRWIPCMLLFVSLTYWGLFFRSAYIHMWWLHYMAAPLAILGGLGAATIMTGQDEVSEDVCPARTWRRVSVLFLSGLFLIGSAIRLNTLHEEHIRLLPGEYYEKPSFIKDLAVQLKRASRPDDLILTNLPWPGALHILPYYAQREMVIELHSPAMVEKSLESRKNRAAHFLFWSPAADERDKDHLYGWLKHKGAGKELVVHQHRFFWITLQP